LKRYRNFAKLKSMAPGCNLARCKQCAPTVWKTLFARSARILFQMFDLVSARGASLTFPARLAARASVD
jgi:hypothetical protein